MTSRQSGGMPRQRGRLLLCALAGCGGAWLCLGGQAVLPEDQHRAPVDLQVAADQALGIEDGVIFSLELDSEAGDPVFAAVPIDGAFEFVDLYPWSVRSDQYQVLVQGEGGSLREVEAGPVRTLRGDLLNVPFSSVAGSLEPEGLFARIVLPDGTVRVVEPLAHRVAAAAGDLHVVYEADDVVPHGGQCGADDMRIGADFIQPGDGATNDARRMSADPGGGATQGGCLYVAELACDADVEYFNDYGSIPAVEARINSVINTVNQQYENEVGITHEISAIIVRTSEPDPYSSTNAETLLNQFRDHWNANHGTIQRDVAQLFTGKNLSGGTIGIAWLNAVCTSFHYNVVESDFNGNFGCATDLSAHELGHNWGANHCSCSSYTMNPFITCANRFHPTFSIPEIISFRDSRTCIECDGGNDPVEAPLTRIVFNRGTNESGGLPELANSDNQRVVISSAPNPNNNFPQTNTVIVARAHINNPVQIDLTVEMSTSRRIRTFVYFWNYSTARWDRIDIFWANTGDLVRQISFDSNATDYIASNRIMKIRILTTNRTLDHEARIDHVEFLVTDP